MSLFLNGRTYSCLVCPKSSPACTEQRHPLQRLISYDELIAKYARKMNRDQYDPIRIYTCPYCAQDRLTVDALYEHTRDTHPPATLGNNIGSHPAVHCPVCVCFRLENSPGLIRHRHGNGLSEHMLGRHCFASTHQYQDELKLRNDFCCDGEYELIRFMATFLPPAIISSEQADECDKEGDGMRHKESPSLVCPICLEQMDQESGKSLNQCVHQFHLQCIDRWLKEKKCCPVCRCDCS
uniref:RING-type domain-containing protein n=1 Tax=Anopheles epiroticus TaxID=199890 RepID=A0A182PGW5_9DIPT